MNNDTKKPLILITNDDGISAKGINELVEAVRELGEVVVFAPDGPRSGMSSAITSIHPIRFKEIRKEEGVTYYRCTGSPVDCVKLYMHAFPLQKPDIVLSGINHGGNMAVAVIYSGTMGAAMEGCIFGISSIGFSITDHHSNADFTESKRIAKDITAKILANPLPEGIYLNVNIPEGNAVKGIKICKQAKGKWVNEYMQGEDPSGNPVYWLTGEFRDSDPDNEANDTWALDNGYASVVPCKIDATDYDFMQHFTSWENQ